MAFTGSLVLVAIVWFWALFLERRRATASASSVRWWVVGGWLGCAAGAVIALWTTYGALETPDRDQLSRGLGGLRVAVACSYLVPVAGCVWLAVAHLRSRPAE